MNREDQINRELDALYAERETLRSRKTLLCACGKRSQISKWILIRDHHYIRPSGCSGGDYWMLSDEYHLVCPKCNGVGRLYEPTRYASIEFTEKDEAQAELYKYVKDHAKYFGETLDSYKDGYDLEVLREKKKKSDERKYNL